MATSTLVTHCGARVVPREELDAIEAPAPTQTWFPIKHAVVIDTVAQALTHGGFAIRQSTYALSRDNARMFGLCRAGHNENCAECRIMQGAGILLRKRRAFSSAKVRIIRHRSGAKTKADGHVEQRD